MQGVSQNGGADGHHPASLRLGPGLILASGFNRIVVKRVGCRIEENVNTVKCPFLFCFHHILFSGLKRKCQTHNKTVYQEDLGSLS